jgi:very-short-patch-repair endonuclease
MYDELTQRGYWVTPQVGVGQYRIDMVVEGHNDARLAIECDGDKYHGADKWADDMQRQRVLERAGWVFWRCFASAFIRRRKDMLNDLLKTLAERGIEPIGSEGAPRSVHTEQRAVQSVVQTAVAQGVAMPDNTAEDTHVSIPESTLAPTSSSERDAPSVGVHLPPSPVDGKVIVNPPLIGSSGSSRDVALASGNYVEYAGPPGDDPRNVSVRRVSEGIVRIVEVEGPVIAKRAYEIYLRSCGIKRMGHEIRSTLNKALGDAIRAQHLVYENEVPETDLLFSVVRVNGSPPINLRKRGPRSFEEIPPSEIQVIARYLSERHGFPSCSDEHLRAVLEWFDLKRLTTQVGTTLREILERSFPYVDEFLGAIRRG